MKNILFFLFALILALPAQAAKQTSVTVNDAGVVVTPTNGALTLSSMRITSGTISSATMGSLLVNGATTIGGTMSATSITTNTLSANARVITPLILGPGDGQLTFSMRVNNAGWSVFYGPSTIYGAMTLSAGSPTTFSRPVYFDRTPTISPAQWYAVFYIPVGAPGTSLTLTTSNQTVTVSSGGTASVPVRTYTLVKTYWTDFELKGCTMDAGTTLNVHWKYFSFDNDAQVYPQIYTVRPDVYFFSPYFNSRIAHKLATYETSIFQRLDNDSSAASDNGVTGWIVVVKEPLGASWFNPYNTALYWTYRKSRSDTAETNAYGSEVWRPIAPIWTTQLPAFSTLN